MNSLAKKTIRAAVIAALLCLPAAAMAANDMYFHIKDTSPGYYIVAGRHHKEEVRDQQKNRSEWRFESAGNGCYYILDRNNIGLVAGDNYDGRIYYQKPANRQNAQWRVEQASPEGCLRQST